jgi:phage terminase large subunit
MQAGFKQFRPFQKGEFILAFADTAAGGGDNCAVQFLSYKWLDQVMVYHSKVTATWMTPLIHEELVRISKETGVPPIVSYETNNGGGFELDRLSRLNKYGDYRIATMKNLDPTGRLVDTGKLGYNTNTATRPKMLQELKDAVDSSLLHLYHRQTIDEMFSFIISSTGKPEAEDGAHDDLVMSLAGAWQLYQTESPKLEANSGGVVETSEYGNVKEAGIIRIDHDY